MEVFKIGKTEVPVSVKPNKRLKGRRLSVSPSGVLVEAPEELLGSIETFLEAKSSWIFAEWQKHKGAIKQSPWPEEFATGAKVLYLGRYTPITVNSSQQELAILAHANHFEVECPSGLDQGQKNAAVKSEFVDLFSEILSALAIQFAKVHEFSDLKIKVNQRQDRWAACKEDSTVVLGWDLIFLPKPVIEYVIVHELVHTRERNHSKDFWCALAAYLPDWRERESELRRFEGTLPNFGNVQ